VPAVNACVSAGLGTVGSCGGHRPFFFIVTGSEHGARLVALQRLTQAADLPADFIFDYYLGARGGHAPRAGDSTNQVGSSDGRDAKVQGLSGAQTATFTRPLEDENRPGC
jgi:hypothetical protein